MWSWPKGQHSAIWETEGKSGEEALFEEKRSRIFKSDDRHQSKESNSSVIPTQGKEAPARKTVDSKSLLHAREKEKRNHHFSGNNKKPESWFPNRNCGSQGNSISKVLGRHWPLDSRPAEIFQGWGEMKTSNKHDLGDAAPAPLLSRRHGGSPLGEGDPLRWKSRWAGRMNVPQRTNG